MRTLMLQVVRHRRGPRLLGRGLLLLVTLGIVLFGLPLPTASAASTTGVVLAGPYGDSTTAAPLGAVGTDTTPEWVVSDDDGLDDVYCSFGSGAAPAPSVSAWTLCAAAGTSATFAPGPLAEGSYTLSAADHDATAGAFGPVRSSSYAVDLAPVVTIRAPAGTSDETPTWDVSVSGAETATCSVTGGGTTLSPGSCTGSVSVDLAGQSEGTYTLSVSARDGGGTTTETSSYTLDRTPGPVTVSISPAIGAANNAFFDVTLPTPAPGDAPFTVTCTVTATGSVPVADATPACSPTTTSVKVSMTADAAYTLTVRATDADGDHASDDATFTRDTTKPTVTFTDGPSGAGQVDSLTWSWTVVDANPATAATCRLVVDGAPQAPVSCTGPSHTFPVSGQSTYGFSVVVRDVLGNLSQETTSPATYRRDTIAPVVTAGAPASPSQTGSVRFTATVDDPAAVLECRLARTSPTALTVFDFTTCPTAEVPLPGDGSYTFTARATDDGQTTTATATYVLDTTGPDAVAFTRAWATPTGDATLTWGLSAPERGVTRSCRFTEDGGTPTSWTACATSVGFPSGATSGSYLLEVRDVDAALNQTITAAAVVELDLIAPAAPFVATGPSGVAAEDDVLWTFAFPAGTPADAGTVFQCQLRGPSTASSFPWRTCATPFPYTLTEQGSYVLDVRAIDKVGNVSPAPVSSSSSYRLDSIAPEQPLVAGPSGTGSTTAVEWTFSPDPAASLTDDPVGAVCYRYFAGALVETVDPCVTPLRRTLSGEGLHRLDVVLVDAADSYGPVGTSASYLLDTIRPAAPVVRALTGPPPSSTPSITWEWTAESVASGGHVQCRLLRDGLVLGADFGPTNTCVSPRSDSGLADASYQLQVRVVDAAGNVGLTGSSAAYVIDTGAPAVPTFPGAPTGSSTTRDVTWTISAEAGSTLTCRLVKDGDTSGSFTSCGTSYPVTGLADGSYVLQAISRDAALNTSGTGSSPTYVVDTTGPATPVVSGPSGKGNVRAVRWTWTSAETTATARCQLRRGTAVHQAWAACTSPYDVTLPAGDSTWSLEVQLFDALLNPSAVATSPVYDLKTSVPATPTVTAPASPSNNRTPLWSFSTEAGTTAECRLLRNTVAGVWSGCGTPHSRDLSSAGDASYVLEVRLSDLYGNTSPTGTALPYVLDTAAPAAPSLTTSPVGPSQDTTPTWEWTGEAGATAQCQLLRGGVISTDWTACATGYTPDLATDGRWTLKVRLRDAALNTSAVTTAADYVLDRVAPAPPVAVGPASPTRTPVATWTLPAPAAGDTRVCRVTLDGRQFTAFAACTTSVGPVALGADGAYRLEAQDTDAALNSSAVGTSLPLVLDTLAPGLPQVSGPTGSSSDSQVSWSITTPTDATAECRLERGGVAVFDYVGCAPTVTRTLTTDGTHVLLVRSVDAAGNRSSSVPSDPYTLDREKPAPPVISGPSGDGSTTAVRWTFTAEADATATCTLRRGGTVTETVTRCTSPVERTLTPDGTWTLQVVATDAAQNSSDPGVSSDYRLDTLAPLAPVVTGETGPTSSTLATWEVAAEVGRLQCRLSRDRVVLEDWATCTAPVTRRLTGDGGYVLDARVVDAAGNTGAIGSSPVRVLDTAAPTVPVVTGPEGPHNTAAVTWTITADAGTTSRCRLLVGGVASEAFAPCSSPVARTLPSDGSWQLEVVSYDGAANASVAGRSPAYLLDTVAPAAAAVTGPTGTSNVAAVSYGFAVPSGHTAHCVLRRDGVDAVTLPGCSSPLLRTLGSDGSYVLAVWLTDAAGNTGAAGTSPAYLLDTVEPAAPVVTGSLGPSQSRAPAWTFTGGAATSTCRVLRGTVVVVDVVACAGGFTADLAGQPDGGYVLQVSTTDAAGNTSPLGSSAPYQLDTTAPAPAVVAGPTGPSPDATPDFSWTGETGAAATCRYARDGGLPGPATACTSPTSPALSPDGTWTLQVELTDAAGNTSLPASSPSYVLDTTAPAAPVVTPPAPVGRDRLPTFGVVAEAGARLECRVTGPGVLRDWRACTPPVDVDLTGLPDGSYVLWVRATDAAGLLSPVGSGTYLLDTVAPAAPVVTVPATGRTSTPTFAFTSEPGTTATCRLSSGTALLDVPTACTSPTTVDLAGLPDGPYNLNVRLTDEAGNTGAGGLATHVLDTTAPAAPAFLTRPASPSPDRAPTWSFRLESGSTPLCRLVLPSGAFRDLANCASPLTVDLSGLADGSYSLQVRAMDPAGNVSVAAVAGHVLDSSALQVPVVTSPASPSSGGLPTWRFTVPAGTTGECRLVAPSGDVLSDWASCPGTFTATLFGRPDGAYRLAVRARSGTSVSAAAVGTYVYDTTAPAAPLVVSPPTPSTVASPTFTLSSPETGATAQCRLLRFGSTIADWRSCPVSVAGSQYTVTLPGGGSYRLDVRVLDAAGNVGAIGSATYDLVTDAPPAVSVTSPASPGFDVTPTWTFSTAAGNTLECRVSGPTGDVVPLSTCTSPFTADLSNRPDGAYVLTVHAVSAAGAVGPDTTVSYTLSTAKPATPSTPVGPTGPSPDRHPAWTFTLPAGSTGLCTVYSSAGGLVVQEACDGARYVLDLTRHGDATYTLTVQARSESGVLSDPSQAVTYQLLTKVAALPVFTLVPGSPSSTTEPTWAFTTDPGTTAECRLLQEGLPTERFAACDSPETALLASSPDGRYALEVRAVNPAGAGPAARSDYVLDRSALPLPTIVSAPATPGRSTTPQWQLAAPAGHTLQCSLDGAAYAACGTSHSPTLRADGTYVLAVRAADGTGRVGAPVQSTYVLDTAAPAPPVLHSAAVRASDVPEAWQFQAPSGFDVIECTVTRDGVPVPTATTRPCTSPFGQQLIRDGGPATYVLTLRAFDLAGNASSAVTGSFRYDVTAPAAPVLVTRPPSSGTSAAPTWAFTVSTDSVVSESICSTSTGGRQISSGPCTTSYTMPLSGAAAGVYAFAVTVRDAAGNERTYPMGSYTLLGARSRVDAPVRPRPPVLIEEPEAPAGPPAGPPVGPGPGGSGPVAGPVAQPDLGFGGAPGGALLSAAAGGDPVPPRPGFGGTSPAAPAPGEADPSGSARRSPGIGSGNALADGLQVPSAIADVVTETFKRPQLPLALLVIVVLFLLVQNRIDRRDPKLAGAPSLADDDLEFGPVLRPGGAPA